ncbi:MAG: 3-alpha domain-containing protein [Paracoccus sp. (in: a-proteobacteria)]|nr:3-alpha domain-containing protein [Paracoccus sp. (in: a-proteobacteria)]
MARDELAQMAALDLLPEGWRKYARNRLTSGKVEDWRARLQGH